ncbi:unnamed protein product, partial [Medioppia subpectinata]
NNRINDIEIFNIIKELGSGGFGSVFEVRHKYTDQRFAIKKCQLYDLSEKKKQNILTETEKLLKLRSHYVIQYYYSWIQNNCLCFLMECLVGNLEQVLKTKSKLFGKIMTEFEYYISYEIFKQLVESVEYLHKNNIIHRDLKPDNVLIDNTYSRYITLCDFGLSKEVKVLSDRYKQSNVKNTDISDRNISYMAPEAQSGTDYNHLIDVYSLALIGAKIFGFDSDDIRDGILNNECNFSIRNGQMHDKSVPYREGSSKGGSVI